MGEAGGRAASGGRCTRPRRPPRRPRLLSDLMGSAGCGVHSTIARNSLPSSRSPRNGAPATDSERHCTPEHSGGACHAEPPFAPFWAALQRLWAGPGGAAPATGAGGARRRRQARLARSGAARPACRARAAPRDIGDRRRAPETRPAPARPAARRRQGRPPLARCKATRRPAGRQPANRTRLPPPGRPRRRRPVLRARQRRAPAARRAHHPPRRAARPARTAPALPCWPLEMPGRAPGPCFRRALGVPAQAPGPPAPAGPAGTRACRATARPAPAARAARRPPRRRPAAAAPRCPCAPTQAPRCPCTARRRAPGRAARAALSGASWAAALPQAGDAGAGSPSVCHFSTGQSTSCFAPGRARTGTRRAPRRCRRRRRRRRRAGRRRRGRRRCRRRARPPP